ncbi:hypothetical protein ZWY2020_015038 [Hordeum vulgare]|nr:hypothetical protein ZWY2020_015038 [Hordeum vulgare]
MRSCMPPRASAAGVHGASPVSSTGGCGRGVPAAIPREATVPGGGSPPEIGEDDGDLQLVIAGTSVDRCPPRRLRPRRRRRSLPGTPDPSAEVIALSPRTLMATNRFVCEICHKGFQRDQNLQLHRRGHNLPWKLRRRGAEGGRRRGSAPTCPEPACVHRPRRALGDLTGIKKHFCRKHGEKKWKCDRCAKRYAVHSDWKAHAKVCGTREYRCDCGTLFSRRDSFVTHRAFCDALAQENNKLAQPAEHGHGGLGAPGPAARSQPPPHAAVHPRRRPRHGRRRGLRLRAAGHQSPHLKMFSDYDADAAAADNPLGCMLSSLGATTPSAFSPSSRLGMLEACRQGRATPAPWAAAATPRQRQPGEHVGHGAAAEGGPDGRDDVEQLRRRPFGPTRVYDRMVGFGVGRLMPGQLYNDDGASGADNPLEDERRRAEEEDDLRVVDYMGVQHQRTSFGSVATTSGGGRPFADHTGPWA